MNSLKANKCHGEVKEKAQSEAPIEREQWEGRERVHTVCTLVVECVMSQVERVNHRGWVLRQRRRHLLWKIPGDNVIKGNWILCKTVNSIQVSKAEEICQDHFPDFLLFHPQVPNILVNLLFLMLKQT